MVGGNLAAPLGPRAQGFCTGHEPCPSPGGMRLIGSLIGCSGLLLVACAAGRDDGGPSGGEGEGEDRLCVPDRAFCEGNEIRDCSADGMSSTPAGACPADEVCRSGVCVAACDAAREDRSNVGCEYWAVDLDNEFASGPLVSNDAAGQPFAVAIANPSDVTVHVTIEQNDAPPGEEPRTAIVHEQDVAPDDLAEIELPQREVDGSVNLRDDGPGTFVSSNAFRITTNYPVVAYQFNPIIQAFSNDASLLIPTSGLDTRHRILGWPTANPISVDIPGFEMEGIPDHSFVTIVGVTAGTEVEVTLGGPIVGGGGIAATVAGDVVRATLGPFDVLNLESDGVPGDLTGTVVTSTAPVAVFSGGERGIAPIDPQGVAAPPAGAAMEDVCCTDHLEEQVFPTTSWGRDFVITRSPVRSDDASWAEPDLYRIIADRDGTRVSTTLPPPNDSFTLDTNEWRGLSAQTDFVLRADGPISIEQILVSQAWVGRWKDGHGGDPSMILFPPVEQHRDHYLFLVPSTFTANYVVVAMPAGTVVQLDGRDVNADEFRSLCSTVPVGEIDGVAYLSATCPVDGGTHRVDASVPVGITVYGYYAVGSYGYAGGANLTQINLF